ncbi:MAG: hypothetical protein ACYSU0_16000, partial [Planctomycetota bacterium]
MCGKTRSGVVLWALSGLLAGCGAGYDPDADGPEGTEAGAARVRAWKDTFDLEKCTLLSAGRNTYFILQPGYQIVLAKQGGGITEQVAITVLNETVNVDGVEARVVEEREFLNGKLKEVSRNFFTICREHNDVFYHGEDVDDYRDGRIVGHGGAWRAGVRGARAGLMMPGKIEMGSRFYQEVAPGVAMDRAEIVRDDMAVESPLGKLKGCLKVIETTPLEPGDESLKVYAPGIGMVIDDELVLVEYGHKRTSPKAPIEIAAGAARTYAEVEIPAAKMPAPVAAAIARLHPTGRIHEVKRETRPGGRVVYA